VSKSFTALSIMQLVQAHSVQLDAPVRRYLPSFRLADGGAYAKVNLRHLLTHTSGIPEVGGHPSAGRSEDEAGSSGSRSGERAEWSCQRSPRVLQRQL
jgi:CubicO group peptidase (beta-lactamase class C family)